MAIAYDAVSEGYRDNSAGTTTTWSHTCTGTDRFLYVTVATYEGGDGDQITGVTYNGVSMTLLNQSTNEPSVESYAFYLANPASGSNTVTVSHAEIDYTWCIAASYTGVDQTTPIDSSATANGNSAGPLSATTTVVGANSWLVSHFSNTNNVTTAGSGTTRRLLSGASLEWASLCDSNGTVSTGSQSLVSNLGASGNHVYNIASLKEASAGGGGSAFSQAVIIA